MMKTKNETQNVELRSEEVQELMGKIPPAILRVGISFILLFVILIYVASNFVKYPDIISTSIVAKNVNYVEEVKASASGMVIESNMDYGHVCKGDTLVIIKVNKKGEQDKLFITSPISGIVYPCDVFQKYDYVEENSVLCVVVDSVKEKIDAKAYATADVRIHLTKGMPVEASIHNNTLTGTITNVANYANPYNGTYVISMEFNAPKELDNAVVWNIHTYAEIRTSECSVFDKFLKERFR